MPLELMVMCWKSVAFINSPLVQRITPRFLRTSRRFVGSHSRLNAPAAGISSSCHDVRAQFLPVLWFTPNFIPGKRVSVGLSKLLHSSSPSVFTSRSTKLPESSNVAVTFRLVWVAEEFVGRGVSLLPIHTGSLESHAMHCIAKYVLLVPSGVKNPKVKLLLAETSNAEEFNASPCFSVSLCDDEAIEGREHRIRR
nr:hypothetical protein PanWU01x14_339960 [Ipomoea trifida]